MSNQSQNVHLRPYLALGVGVLSLGFSAIFVQWAEAPSAVVSFYRTGIATLLLALPFFQRAKGKAPLSRRGLTFAALGGLLFALDLTFFAEGVIRSGATNPTLLANTAPLWVGLGALLIFRENLNVKFWSGLLFALFGAVVIVGLDALESISLGIGTFFGLLAGIFYGGYFLVTQKGREQLGVLTYFWPAAATSTLTLVIIGLLLQQPFTGYPLRTYLSFLGLGVFSQVIGWMSINYAQGFLPASIVSPTMFGQPVVTALLAVVLLGENLTLWQVLGGLTVLAGVYIVHRSRSELTQRSSAAL